MKLKVKLLNFSAGRPVAILNKHFARNKTIHVDDRVYIKNAHEKITSVVDVSKDLVSENEIALSSEIKDKLKLSSGDEVEIEIAVTTESI